MGRALEVEHGHIVQVYFNATIPHKLRHLALSDFWQFGGFKELIRKPHKQTRLEREHAVL